MKQIKMNLKNGGAIIIGVKNTEIEKYFKNNPEELIQQCIKRGDVREGEVVNLEFLKKGEHFCEYCGKVVEGNDKDVLCDECRMTFGHKYYSEL